MVTTQTRIAMEYPHLFLKNTIASKSFFHKTRFISEEEEEENPKNYTLQKETFRENKINFEFNRQERIRRQSIPIPIHLEYIEINFLNVFNTPDLYLNKFGLRAVSYYNFNQSVLFCIIDSNKFEQGFMGLLDQFCSTSNHYDKFDVITFIHSFSFLSTNKIDPYHIGGKILLSLIDDIYIQSDKAIITRHLVTYLSQHEIQFKQISPEILEITNISKELTSKIVDNFDIIQKIQASPALRISPSPFNVPRLSWNIDVQIPNNLPTIGIIDTGVENIAPFQPIYQDPISILPQGHNIESSHGTNVASLAVFGNSLTNNIRTKTAACKILSIQIIQNDEDNCSLSQLKDIITKAHQKQEIKIFNLSITSFAKSYNSPISTYAYILDELAYNLDILIFIATGNLNPNDVSEISNYLKQNDIDEEEASFLKYPNHFYRPKYNTSMFHACESSNICEPSESMNNITVGAIAENFIDNPTDLTTDKAYPTYYTKKFHIDYAQPILGLNFKRKQCNKNIFKPDIVMPGGDWLSKDSSMYVLGRGGLFNFYELSAGTSLATPLATHLAAQIIHKYPSFSSQTIKALIINSAENTGTSHLMDSIVEYHKNQAAMEKFGQSFDQLNGSDRKKISALYNSERLYKKLIGHGLPNSNKCIYSTNKSVTFIIEDSIKKDFHKAINLKLPDYLLQYSKKEILKVTATLCFKFKPEFNNQLGYNPLHISFNFAKTINNNIETLDILSTLPAESIKKQLAIKTKLDSWSEDFYPANSKIFSNVQKMELNIAVSNLKKVNNEISVLIRCTGRDNSPYVENTQHPFSLVVRVDEKHSQELDKFNLYEELSAINSVETIAEADIEIEQEAML